ncbi:MAG: Cobalt-zinc-cadmium resistance protein CzcC [Syntrophus sp. SKADARSKE-3]|nr:Cobalt-zinc-cadmium resistance protein CzcC [Syntrophus sp. SKADARSKE-3]
MHRNIIVVFIVIAASLFSSLSIDAAAEGQSLTLDQALSMALRQSPELSAFNLEIEAREAAIVQAGVFPNPEIEVRTEGIYGNKDRTGFSSAESFFSLGQTVELAGKRSKRINLAQIDRNLSRWDWAGKRLDVALEVTKNFVDLLVEQERVRLQEEMIKVAEQSFGMVSARVLAGKVSPIDETRASAAYSIVQIDLERARRSLESVRKKLSALLGETTSLPFIAVGVLEIDSPMPEYGDLLNQIQSNPDIARWKDENEQRSMALDLEKAKRIPDPVITGGLKRYSENQENTFLAGISFPLPIFNTNKGAIQAAQKRLTKAQEEKKAAALKAQTTLAEAYQTASSSLAEAESLKNKVIPALQNAHDSIYEGYSFGKFGYIDVLDAQRGLFEARVRYVDSLASYKKALAGIWRLTGTYSRKSNKGQEK